MTGQFNPLPTLERIMAMLNGYQQTAILKGAIDLGVFSEIATGVVDAAGLARRCAADPRGMEVLCDALTILGLLDKQADAYSLTPDSAAFLDRRSPAYLGTMTQFMLAPEMTGSWSDIAGLVRTGGPTHQANIAPENPIWVKFATSMVPMIAGPAKLLAQLVSSGGAPNRILDIAAGHGLFGIELAKQAGDSHVTAVDWPLVLEVARRNADAAGLGDRWAALPGSAFDVEFGEGYDVVLLANFLHHFDGETCRSLLAKAHRSLVPGGRVVTLEFVPDEGGISPPLPALFSMVMLVTTPKGRAYRFSELDAFHRDAGFERCEHFDLPPSPERVVIGYKA